MTDHLHIAGHVVKRKGNNMNTKIAPFILSLTGNIIFEVIKKPELATGR